MFRIALVAVLAAWASIALWNAAKPMPPGTRVTSFTARLAESQIALIQNSPEHRDIEARELAAIDHADDLIVIDQAPVSRALGQHLLLRKRQRPNVKVVLIADPLDEDHGGTPAEYLSTLEASGVIVARARLDRLRDATALYSAFWRMSVGWWSDPYDEPAGGLRSALRRLNLKRDHRQLIVADDGAGGWVSLVPGNAAGDLAVQISGGLARDIIESELRIAAWSSGDDRLPSAPAGYRGVGSIDARFLSEGAIRAGLIDALGSARAGDEIDLATRALGDRPIITALLEATARGAHVRVLLDASAEPNRAVASELSHAGGGLAEVRWSNPAHNAVPASFLLVRRRGEYWLSAGAADFTRLSLGDLNLGAAVELKLPERSPTARSLADYFAKAWLGAAAYPRYALESRSDYWRYRVLEAAGLVAF